MTSDAAALGDIVELRLDCLSQDQLRNSSALLSQLTRDIDVPIILTLRDPAQGGANSWPRDLRRNFWRSQLLHTESMFDVEYDLVRELAMDQSLMIDWSKVICSHHDFEGVPENLNDIFERLAATPAGVVKIAVAPRDGIDCLPLFRLLEHAQQRNRRAIILAMGNPGVMTRVLGPSRGAYLTYASLEADAATAPGQITARDLRSVYRIDKINQETMITGLIGNPVMHSVSPEMHNAAFETEHINGVYLPFQVSNPRSFFERMVHPATREINWNLKGFSVTAPHKSTVFSLLDWIEPRAQQIGVVNTVVLDEKTLRGYNTDADGFIDPLLKKLQSIMNSRVAVLGAGGAANAVVWALKAAGCEVTLFARDLNKAKTLSQKFDVRCEQLNNAIFSRFDVVVNTTPLGTAGTHASQTPAFADQLQNVGLVYDLIYNPKETELLKQARLAGCQTLGGLSMLVAQACLQFELWTGRKISASLMTNAALAKLTKV